MTTLLLANIEHGRVPASPPSDAMTTHARCHVRMPAGRTRRVVADPRMSLLASIYPINAADPPGSQPLQRSGTTRTGSSRTSVAALIP